MMGIDTRGLRARVNRWGAEGGSRDRRGVLTFRALLILAVVQAPFSAALLRDRMVADRTPVPALASAELLSAELPLHMNDRVSRWVERFRTDQRPSFQRLLGKQGLYADMIRAKLVERDMPVDLLYMAMMESAFSTRAVSRASAVGVWQFMGPTALQYGLRVDEWVDERQDPVRATDAALDYIEWLYDRYDSWYLAAAAYNAGPGRVDRILRRHADGRTGDEDIYWEVLEHLPRETREYVPRLVAATHLAQNAEEYGFSVKLDKPYRYERVFVPAGTSLARVARELGADEKVLRDLNPHLLKGITPPGETYPVRVPVGETSVLISSLRRTTRVLRRADD